MMDWTECATLLVLSACFPSRLWNSRRYTIAVCAVRPACFLSRP